MRRTIGATPGEGFDFRQGRGGESGQAPLGLGRHHGRRPGRIPHDLDLRLPDAGEIQQHRLAPLRMLSCMGQPASSASSGSPRAPLDAHVVDQAERDDVDAHSGRRPRAAPRSFVRSRSSGYASAAVAQRCNRLNDGRGSTQNSQCGGSTAAAMTTPPQRTVLALESRMPASTHERRR